MDSEYCDDAELAKEARDLAQKARDLVLDYYGTAVYGGAPAAMVDLMEAERMTDAEILEEAKKLRLLE